MELLVAMAIIGILVALILPAVQNAREAARRLQCKNQIRQIVLAMHQYHDAHGSLPLNFGYGPYTDANSGASWMQRVLPFLDQANLHSRILVGQPLNAPQNRAVAEFVVPVFLCPSDANFGGRSDFRSNVPGTWAINNYKACAGSNWAWGDFGPVPAVEGNTDGLDHCDGLICRGGHNQGSQRRLADILDGTSQTFAVGEAVPEWCRHTWWYWFNGVTATCAIPLNYKDPGGTRSRWQNRYSFFSYHPAGGNFALADGSVTYIRESINLTTYRAMATIRGGEVFARD